MDWEEFFEVLGCLFQMWVPGLHPRPPESDTLGAGQGLWVEREVPAR